MQWAPTAIEKLAHLHGIVAASPEVAHSACRGEEMALLAQETERETKMSLQLDGVTRITSTTRVAQECS